MVNKINYNDIKNIKITLAYDGSKFQGWTRNFYGDNSVEDVLTNALSDILEEKILLISASRLDKRVHARGQVVNFRTIKKITPEVIKNKLREKLDYIYILSVEEVSPFFHSRHSAIGKIYTYQIWNDENIVREYLPYCYFVKERLNIEELIDSSKLFIGRKDFRNFSKAKEGNTIRTIFNIKVNKIKSLIKIEITGDGFLYNMVRCIVASLLNLSLGKISAEEILEMFTPECKKRKVLLAPPEGLFLEKVIY